MGRPLHQIIADFIHSPESSDFDIENLILELRDKVDDYKWVVDHLEAAAETLDKKWLQPLIAKRNAIRNKAEAIEKRIKEEMLKNEWDDLIGNCWRFHIQKGNASVECARPPSAQDFIMHEGLVKQDIIYAWDKKKIKEHIDQGVTLDFATIKETKVMRAYTYGGDKK